MPYVHKPNFFGIARAAIAATEPHPDINSFNRTADANYTRIRNRVLAMTKPDSECRERADRVRSGY